MTLAVDKSRSAESRRTNAGFRWLEMILVVGFAFTIPASGQDQPTAVRAKRLYNGLGGFIENGVILFQHGRILAVGPGLTVPARVPVVEREVLAPGFVDVRTRLGSHAHSVESAESSLLGARAGSSVDLDHRDFRLAVRGGITTVAVMPGGRSMLSGRGSILKTGGGSRGMASAKILRERGPLLLNLGRTARSARRTFPSTPAGLVQHLREIFGSGGKARGEWKGELGEFAAGRETGFLSCPENDTLVSLLPTLKELQLPVVLLPYADRGDGVSRVVAHLEDFDAPVVLGPYSLGTPTRELRVPGAFERAGLEVVLTSDAPVSSPQALRLTAALALRYGLSEAGAWKGLTSASARRLGLEDRVGVLSPGRDADFVAWSGDPLDLASRVEETYIEGRLIFRAGHRKGTLHLGSGGGH